MQELFCEQGFPIYDFTLAKKSAIIKLVKKLGTNPMIKAQNKFIEDIFQKDNSTFSLIEKIHNMTPSDFETNEDYCKDEGAGYVYR